MEHANPVDAEDGMVEEHKRDRRPCDLIASKGYESTSVREEIGSYCLSRRCHA